ncbi:MAG TPA: hypothetical protein VHF26_20740 [Trebonia sp.]|nr:hypothetical protein [Trebonia sp.]
MTASVSERRNAAPVPRSATWAVRVMYGGAAASIAGIAINVSTLGVIRRQRPIMSMALRTSTYHQAIMEFVVGGVIAAAVWTFMAYSCHARMRWARIAATVLFAIYTVYTAELVVRLDQVSPPGAVQVYTVIVWLIGLTATILLWQRGSSAYFAVPRRPERATRP